MSFLPPVSVRKLSTVKSGLSQSVPLLENGHRLGCQQHPVTGRVCSPTATPESCGHSQGQATVWPEVTTRWVPVGEQCCVLTAGRMPSSDTPLFTFFSHFSPNANHAKSCMICMGHSQASLGVNSCTFCSAGHGSGPYCLFTRHITHNSVLEAT